MNIALKVIGITQYFINLVDDNGSPWSFRRYYFEEREYPPISMCQVIVVQLKGGRVMHIFTKPPPDEPVIAVHGQGSQR